MTPTPDVVSPKMADFIVRHTLPPFWWAQGAEALEQGDYHGYLYKFDSHDPALWAALGLLDTVISDDRRFAEAAGHVYSSYKGVMPGPRVLARLLRRCRGVHDLPSGDLRIWRGFMAHPVQARAVARRSSWTRDFDTAAWFACGYRLWQGRSLAWQPHIAEAVIRSEDVLLVIDDRNEAEVVVHPPNLRRFVLRVATNEDRARSQAFEAAKRLNNQALANNLQARADRLAQATQA